MDVLNDIEKWKLSKNWEEGLRLYLTYTHRKNTTLQKRLKMVRVPTQRHWESLQHELDMIERLNRHHRAIIPNADPELQKVKAIVKAVVKKEKKKKVFPKEGIIQKKEEVFIPAQPNKAEHAELLVDLLELSPKALEQEMERLYKQRRILAQKRALLSNQFEEDRGNAAIIENNQRLVSEIRPILDELEEIEYSISSYEAGELKDTEPINSIVVSRKTEQYTVSQLNDMPMAELRKLRKRLNDDRLKAEKTLKGKIRNERNRGKYEKIVFQRKHERVIVTKIIDFKDEHKASA